MSSTLLKDSDWALLDGCICEVTRFVPFAKVESGKVIATNWTTPYASVTINCHESGVVLPTDAVGSITHKYDFKRLWEAFVERGVADDERVFVLWSKRNLKAAAKLISPFMPKLAVTIFKAEAYELLSDSDYRPEFRGEARFLAGLPIHHWQPEVWKERIVPTLYEHYVSSYLRTGDEEYLTLMKQYK
jgi:hypothetical protein